MEGINKFALLFLLVVSSAYYADGDLDVVPENTVGLEGSTVTLRCSVTATPTSRVVWTEYVTQDEGRFISDNKGIVPTHPNANRYAITGGALDFNLQIFALNISDGGRYMCQDTEAQPPRRNRATAELIAMDGDPKCTEISTVTGVIVEDRFYWKECTVNYRGNFVPQMSWVGPGEYNRDYSLTERQVWSRISFVADRGIDGGQFICTTNFSAPGGLPPDAASNTPSYQYIFRGSVLIVNWGPQNLDIAPRQPTYQVGDTLHCSADAQPNPTYVWSNLRTQQTEPPGQHFSVTGDLQGTEQMMRCNAFSNIEGTLYIADAFVNVTVPGITIPTTPPTTTPTTPPPADGPCNDLTGQWTSTNPNANLCIEMDSKGNLLALLRNGTDLFFVTGTGKTVINDYKHVGFTAQWPPGSLFGVGGFTGECHSCFGNEIILISGLSRSKDQGTQCGISAGTRLTNLYAFTRFGPPCRTPPVKVYRPSEMHIKVFGIPPENIMT